MKISKSKISDIYAYRQYDSRGLPTIGVVITSDTGICEKFLVPSGSSVGTKEAYELRDHGAPFDGKMVDKAIHNINSKIRDLLIGEQIVNQVAIDEKLIALDATKNKSKLGANAILAVSMAVARLGAKIHQVPLFQYIRKIVLKDEDINFNLPKIMVNVVNGGKHANNKLDFQEFMIVPLKSKSIDQSCLIAAQCFYELSKLLKMHNKSTAKGDEGGFDTSFSSIYEALDMIEKAITNAGYKKNDIGIALDIAASEIYKNKKYWLNKALAAKVITKQKACLDSQQLIYLYEDLMKLYNIVSIEDPFDENDWNGFKQFTKMFGNKLLVVGDDLYCTNKEYLKKGIQHSASNAILIKLNQIGTLSETLLTIKLAQLSKMKVIISHRSGETEDSSIADLAVAINADYIKTGSFSRSERICKYNRLLEIENIITKKKRIVF